MKTRALLLALPLLALAACRDNRASVQLQAVCSPTDDCTFAGECDAQYIGFLTIDASVTGRLWIFMQLENQLPDNESPGAGRLNTNDAHVDEIEVDYDGPALGKTAYQTSFFVGASSTAVISVDVFPPALQAQGVLAGYAPASGVPRDMVANVRLRGSFDDGTRFETAPWALGVRVCNGCLGPFAAACPAGTCPPGEDGFLPITCIQ